MNIDRVLTTCAASLFCCLAVLAQERFYSYAHILSSGPGLRQIGELKTRPSSDIDASPWSVGCETLGRDYADFSLYKDHVGELGVKHARIQSGWAKCEKSRGVYSFGWLDTIVDGLAAQGVEPWICLCYGNPAYGAEMRLGARIFTDEETMEAWLDYVRLVVDRYKEVVKEWEVWNEPRHRPRGAYSNLLMKTAEVVKQVQPGARILGFSLAGVNVEFAREIFEDLQARDKLHLIDYLTYHPYCFNPDDSYEQVDELLALKDSFRPEIKLYQGENGCPSILEWGHALHHYPWTEISQVKWILRRMAGDRSIGVRSSIFTIMDLRYPNMLQSFGLLRGNLLHQVVYKRPSFFAVQHMANVFDASVLPIGSLDYKSRVDRKLKVEGFRKEQKNLVLLWFCDRIPSDDLTWEPVNITIEGLELTDPVFVEMISGRVYELDPENWKAEGGQLTFTRLPAWDSVVMLAERSAIEIIEF